MLTDNNKTDMIPPFKSLGFVRVSSAHQGCIFFNKMQQNSNIVKYYYNYLKFVYLFFIY